MGACQSCAGDRRAAGKLDPYAHGRPLAPAEADAATPSGNAGDTPAPPAGEGAGEARRRRRRRQRRFSTGGSSSESSTDDEAEDAGGEAAAKGQPAAPPEVEDTGAVMAEIPMDVMAAFHEEWNKLDTQGKGYIEGREFTNMLRALYRPSDAEVDEMMARFDVNHDGVLDYDEFRRAMTSVNSRFGLKKYRKYTKRLFHHHDKNEDGVLSGDELKDVVRSLLTIPEHVTRTAWVLFDRDGDARVDFDEFVVTLWRLQGRLDCVWGMHACSPQARRKRVRSTALERTASGTRLDMMAGGSGAAAAVEGLKRKEQLVSEADEAVLPPSYFTAALRVAEVGYRPRDDGYY